MQSTTALGVDTEPPRYNMRRTASRPNPNSVRRGLAKPQAERTTLVHTKANTNWNTKPPGSTTQTNEVVVALAQAAAAVAVAEEVAATQPEPPVAPVDLKHADLQQLVSSDLLLSLMPEAEPENAGGEHLDVKSGPVGAAGASPLDAKPCVGRTSPTDVISAAGAAWSVPSPSCAETVTPILAPRTSKPWACAYPECTKAYSQRDQLRQHARRRHPKWLRCNHKSFYSTSDEVEGSLWDRAEATGWCILEDSQPGRYLYVAPSGRVFASKKAAEAARDQEEIMMLRCDEQIDDLTEQIDSPVLAEALQSLYRATSTVHTKKRKSVLGGESTMAMADEDRTPLVAHPPPKTVAPTQPASPLRPVAHSSTRKIRTVAWEEHSKPKHVLDEDMLDEGECLAVAADPGAQLPWSFWQASTADIELMLLEEHHALHSPTRAPHSGRESPLNLKLVSDSHSSDLAKFMTAEPLPVSHPSPTFIGHNFIGELSCSPAKPVQAKAAFCTLSTALQGDRAVPRRLSTRCHLAGPDGCTLPSRHKGPCELRKLEGRRNNRPPPSPKPPSPMHKVRDVTESEAQPPKRKGREPAGYLADRCILAEPRGKHRKKPALEIERIGLKLAGVDTYVGGQSKMKP